MNVPFVPPGPGEGGRLAVRPALRAMTLEVPAVGLAAAVVVNSNVHQAIADHAATMAMGPLASVLLTRILGKALWRGLQSGGDIVYRYYRKRNEPGQTLPTGGAELGDLPAGQPAEGASGNPAPGEMTGGNDDPEPVLR